MSLRLNTGEKAAELVVRLQEAGAIHSQEVA